MLRFSEYRKNLMSINETEEEQTPIQNFEKEIDDAIDSFARDLKLSLVNSNAHFTAASAGGQGWWDRFKNTVSNIWHGKFSKDNPYYWKNKLGDLGQVDDDFAPDVKTESFDFLPLNLEEYKSLRAVIHEIENLVLEANDIGNLRLSKLIDFHAQKLKMLLKNMFSKYKSRQTPTPQPAKTEPVPVQASTEPAKSSFPTADIDADSGTSKPADSGTTTTDTTTDTTTTDTTDTTTSSKPSADVDSDSDASRPVDSGTTTGTASADVDLDAYKNLTSQQKKYFTKQYNETKPVSKDWQDILGKSLPIVISKNDPRHKIILWLHTNRKNRFISELINSGRVEGTDSFKNKTGFNSIQDYLDSGKTIDELKTLLKRSKKPKDTSVTPPEAPKAPAPKDTEDDHYYGAVNSDDETNDETDDETDDRKEEDDNLPNYDDLEESYVPQSKIKNDFSEYEIDANDLKELYKIKLSKRN